MILDFPSPVSTGTNFTAQNGVVYQYDGVKWTTVGSPITGNTGTSWNLTSQGNGCPINVTLTTTTFDVQVPKNHLFFRDDGSWDIGSYVNETYITGDTSGGNGIALTTDRGTVLFGNSPEQCTPTQSSHFHIMRDDPTTVDLFFGDDFNYVKLPHDSTLTNVGVQIGTDATNLWSFGKDGLLTLPSGNTRIGDLYGSGSDGIIASTGTTFGVLGQGTGGYVALEWIDNYEDATAVAAVVANSPFGTTTGTVQIATGALSGPIAEYIWEFGADGTTTFPNNTLDAGTSTIAIKSTVGAELEYINDNFQELPNEVFNAYVGVDDNGPYMVNLALNSNNTDTNFSIWSVDSNGNLVTSIIHEISTSTGVGDIVDIDGNSIIYTVASETPPTRAPNGRLWYNSVEGRMYIRYTDLWVDASPTVIPPISTYLEGLTIEDTTISAVNNTGTVSIATGVINQWTFDTDGNLTLPAGGSIYGLDMIGGEGTNVQADHATEQVYIRSYNTQTQTQNEWTFGTDGALTVAKDIVVGNNNGHIYIDDDLAGASSIRWVNMNPSSAMLRVWSDGRNDQNNQRLELGYDIGGGLYITTTQNVDGLYNNPGDDFNWKFGADGKLKFPNNSTFDGQTLIDHATGPNYTLKIASGNVAGSKFGIGTGSAAFGIANDALNHAEDGYVPYAITAQRINLTVLGGGSWNFGADGSLKLPAYGVIRGSDSTHQVNIVSSNFSQLQWTTPEGAAETDPNNTSSLTNWLYVDSDGITIQTNANTTQTNIWSFNNSGNITLPKGSVISETAGTLSLQPATANPGQSLVIRPTASFNLSASGYIVPGQNLTITLTNTNNAAVDNTYINYTITDAVASQLGLTSLTGHFPYLSPSATNPQSASIVLPIPLNSTALTFTLTIDSDQPAGSAYTTITVTSNGIVNNEPSHVHLIAGNTQYVDLYLGDDDQYVKIERDHGNVVIGTNTNTNHWTFGTDGILTLPAGGGNEGAEIDFTKAPNSTLSGPTVVLDQYVDRFRFFESTGTNRGAYIDLSQAAAGVGTLLNNRVSAFVNAGTFVTMDNIKATVTTSSNRGLSLATVSGTTTCYISGTFGKNGGFGGSSAGVALTTSASVSMFDWNFTSEGDSATYILNYGYTKSYRITMMIGAAYNNNMITIERLI